MSARAEVPEVAPRHSELTSLGADADRISRVPYLPGLDGMRGIAVVAVMIYHANSGWLKGGFLGVEIFFVISGYLITLLLVAEDERSGHVDMKQFWMRRARRLLPALFTMMLLLTVWTALFERAALGKLRGDVIAGFFYVSNWYQIWTGAGYTEANDFAPLRHLWSLAVEEQFYILWPLVMVLLLRGGSRRVAGKAVWLFGASVAVTILMAVLFYDGPIGTPEVTPDAYWNILGREISIIDTLYLSTITRAGGLLLGAAFALLWRPVAVMRGPLRDKGLRLDLIALVGAIGLGIMIWTVGLAGPEGADPWLFQGGFFIAGLATLMVIAAVTHEQAMTGRLLSNPVLLWIGTRSYGLYLYHWPIYQMIRKVTGVKLTFQEFAVAMVLTVIVTELSYRYIETPIRTGALRRMWRRGEPGDPSRPPKSLVAAAVVAGGLALFAGVSLATADLEQNEVRQSLDASEDFTCDVLVDFDCDGVPDAETTAGSDVATTDDSGGGNGAAQPEATTPPTTVVDSAAAPVTTAAEVPAVVARLAVGDSVMKGAAEELATYGFVVSAEESRSFANGVDYVIQLGDQGQLGDTVVVHLGTNGPIGQSDMDRMIAALADVSQVLLVTIDVDRDYTAGNNALVYDTVNRYDNVFLMDWQGLAGSCPGNCLYDDLIHLRPDGQVYYSRIVAGALGIE